MYQKKKKTKTHLKVRHMEKVLSSSKQGKICSNYVYTAYLYNKSRDLLMGTYYQLLRLV